MFIKCLDGKSRLRMVFPNIVCYICELFQKVWLMFVLLILPTLMLSSGCAYIGWNEGFSYNDAVKQDTPDGYLKFLERNPKSKRCTEARRRLKEFFDESKIKRILICYLSFNYTGPAPKYYNVYDSIRNLHESENTGAGYRIWEEAIKPIVANELENKGYDVILGSSIHTEFDSPGYFPPRLHSKTFQSESVIESSGNLFYGTVDRMTPDFYLAAEPFLKSNAWPDIDGVLLVTIPIVRYALTWTDTSFYASPHQTNDISSISVIYHLFDVKSKRRIFADYVNYIERISQGEQGETHSNAFLKTTTYYWYFSESEDAFFSRAVKSLFGRIPEASSEGISVQKEY